MKAVGVSVSALLISFYATAAATYFYNPENLPPVGTVSVEEKFQTISKIYCALKCSEVGCYEFWWNSGTCNIRRPRSQSPLGRVALFRRKVSLAYSPDHFTVQSQSSVLQKRIVVVKEKKNFTDSEAICKSLGGSLALPESVEENQQLKHELGKNSNPSLRIPHYFFTVQSRATSVLTACCTTFSPPCAILFPLLL